MNFFRKKAKLTEFDGIAAWLEVWVVGQFENYLVGTSNE